MWIDVVDGISVRCVENTEKGKKYRYESKTNDDIIVLGHDNNLPTATSTQSPIHQFLRRTLSIIYATDEVNNRIISIKNELEKHIEVAIVEVDNSQKIIDEKYDLLYANFLYFLEEYDMSPLELIVATTHCLGVGKPREIVRAFLGYFQTYVGYKGTNVIAIGSPASGKSFILETALSMIPSERVIKGAKTVAYFFNKYDGKDLTGYIFFIGDMGGDKDNSNTIEFRDVLKQLSTDGYIERGVMDKDSMEEREQTIEGYPCLSYSTAVEEMVNEQEKTRSIILAPNPIDSAKLVVFNFLKENHGVYHDELEKLESITESIKSLVYKFNPDDYDFFNPYMFAIEEHIKDHDDFNRKILEFNAILKLVTILNDPWRIYHQIYLSDDFEEKDTELILASKRDNINALNIFDSANLLPDESRFANGIIQEYEVPNVFDVTLDEDELWEDVVLEEYAHMVDEDKGELTIGKEDRKFFFTLKSLKRDHRNKRWYRKSRQYVSERVQRLVEESIIVQVGKEKGTGHNVYCLNQGMVSSVDSPLPNFSKKHLDRATNLFKMVYPNQVDEYMNFIENDEDYDTTDLFESISPIIPNLPYLEGVFDGL